MKKKFKIYTNAGEFKPKEMNMVVMNSQGIFFIVDMSDYYTHVRRLSEVIGTYAVVWNGED